MKTGNMINLFLLMLAAIWLGSCTNNNPETDRTAILELLKSETETFAQGNFEEWATHWKQSPDILLTYTMNNANNTVVGWQQLSEMIKSTMDNMGKVESPNFTREYHTVQIDGNMAWAHFTQTDTLDGIPTQKHESRTLARVGTDWKIIGSNIVNQTSFAENQYLLNASHVTGKTHIPVNEFPKDMIINHVEGWGGMSVAINEPPAGADFAPLLEGLKNNSCQVPHWGYLEKGGLRMNYDDGKEEVLNAGEVFYMPPGHTVVVEKDARLIDFSPQQEFKEVVNHIEEKVTSIQKK